MLPFLHSWALNCGIVCRDAVYVLEYGSDILVDWRDILHTLIRAGTACAAKSVARKR
jgi:hypothetical protein